MLSYPVPLPTMPPKSYSVAVIGAGAAGLVAAREVRREGHKVTIFEQNTKIGGTWIYNPQPETDPMSLDPFRISIHSSLYESLRTNLPRELMGFRDFPFFDTKNGSSGGDMRRFPGHGEVLRFLNDFAFEFGIEEMVRFGTEVCFVGLMKTGEWKVSFRKVGVECSDLSEMFDAVVVCSGHYTEPRTAEIPGIHLWPGKEMHSHNYRTSEPFQDQAVVLIGSSASAVDISIEIASVAKEVHIASRSAEDGTLGKLPDCDNMWLHSMIESVHEDGTVFFKDGSAVLADVILHCTGYKYHFPFLKTNGIVTVDDNRVGPLYKHVFPPVLAPLLSFVGLPWKVAPFPMFELQSKWLAGVLSGRIALPSQEEMKEDVTNFYSTLEASGVPKRYTHCVGDSQFEYKNWLAEQCGTQPIEEWRKEMYYATGKNRCIRPDKYRDEWEDQDVLSQAHDDFMQYLSNGGTK